jgi:glycerate-2-kinase
MPQAPAAFLKRLFEAAVSRADPRTVGPLPLPASRLPAGNGRTVVVGAGKASAAFAEAFTAAMKQQGRKVDEGFVICPCGSATSIPDITCHEASHPVPDERSVEGAKKVLQLASDLKSGDDLIVLLSGGGSSLMALPIEGVSLADKQFITDQLLKSGAPIQDINCVRKHLSQIKGGKLSEAAAPARVTTLIISDVVGNDPAVIASGPTTRNTSRPADALRILDRYKLNVPDTVSRVLKNAALTEAPPIDPANETCHLVATPEDALDHAADLAKRTGPEGLTVHNLGCDLEGEAHDVAVQHAAMALDLQRSGGAHLILSGGELTCQLPPDLDYEANAGGPNHVYSLALLKALTGNPGIYALAADTDGKDGSTDAAGAFISPEDFAAAGGLASDLDRALATHNSGDFFSTLGSQIVTGPTHTNVNDFRAILILESNTPGKTI